MRRQLIATFVRHGETSLNVQKLIQGHTDTPLSETGIKQAELLGESLSDVRFTKVYSSDLCRARRTAELICQHSKYPVNVTEDKRLRERSYGELEGQHFQNLVDEAAKTGVKIWECTPKGAETYTDLLSRTRGVLDDLCTLAENSNAEDQENVLLVSHGGWIIALFRDILSREDKFTVHNGSQGLPYRINHNTGVTQCYISSAPNEKFIIDFLKINDTSHLN